MSGEPCPACGGRKVIAVGVHDTKCLACDGTGEAPKPPAAGSKRGAEKPDT